MKIRKVMKIASVVHTILWIVILMVSIIGRITFKNPEMEPLDLYMSRGVYNVLILTAVAGVFSAGLLLLSLCSISATEVIKSKGLKKTALVLSIITNMLFYVSMFLLFLINKEEITVVSIIVWALCATCCCFILITARLKK